MHLQGKDVDLSITTVGCQKSSVKSKLYNITLLDLHGKQVNAQMLSIEKISSEIVKIDCKVIAELFQLEPHMINRPNSGEIDILIGLQQFAYHPVKIRENGHLSLMKNRFGLVVAGSHPTVKRTTLQESCSLVRHATVMHLVESMTRFHSIEGLGITCTPKCGACQCGKCHPGGKDMTLNDEKEYKLIEAGISFDEESKRWIAGYPWTRNPNELPNNRQFALGMMLSTERKIEKDNDKAVMYNRQMQDMVQRKVARQVSEKELSDHEGPKYYITHHAVIKPSSKSTPCRIVFNSSAKYCGSSLNEFLAKGPSLLNSLLGILLRWRQNKVGYIGDISKMYHSIRIPYADQMTHLYFWRDCCKEKKPATYAITAVNMGDRPSACIAQICLRKSAEKLQHLYPEAADIILRNAIWMILPPARIQEKKPKQE